ncbi:MAG: capsular biosynthesis protein [Muribaculaceae bacterium]|nr:capsular biosynthesis protein [Muribaculaceae bacterium]
MWPFSKKYPIAVDGGPMSGYTDWHSHILPGVDDGVETLEESIEILRAYEDMGFAEVWFTPHIMEDIPNTTADLRKRFDELAAAYDGKLSLHLGAENMLDNLFEERLEARDLLPMGVNGDYMLVETSYFNPPHDMTGMLSRIQAAGFYPLLAHPERYMYMDNEDYQRLHANGVKFQLNITSLAGAYGPVAEKKAHWLLNAGMYDYSGTDIHRYRSIEHLMRPCLNSKTMARLKELTK